MIKKNITINLCNSLYNIDEDAYELLKNYLDSIRRYYSKRDGDDEVANDIETRIAELFDEQKAQGVNAITIEITQEVIQRIGKLEDITANEEDSSEKASYGQQNSSNGDETRRFAENLKNDAKSAMNSAMNTLHSGKRFYLDKQNKMICGVMAGLAQYFGGTPFAWRIGLVVFYVIVNSIIDLCGFHRTHLWGTITIAYLIIAVLAPAAESPEDVVRMKGKSVNPQTIAEEVTAFASKSGSVIGSMVSGLARFINTIITTALVIIVVAILCFIALFWLDPDLWLDTIQSYAPVDAFGIYPHIQTPLSIMLASIAVALIIICFGMIHSLGTLFDKSRRLSFSTRTTLLAAFIICVIIAMAEGYKCERIAEPIQDRYEQTQQYQEHRDRLRRTYNHRHFFPFVTVRHRGYIEYPDTLATTDGHVDLLSTAKVLPADTTTTSQTLPEDTVKEVKRLKNK